MRVADLNGFDWVLIAVAAYSMVVASRRGLVRAIFGLLGFVGGFQLASWSYSTVGDWILDSHMITSAPIARIVAFLLIVVAVVAGFELVGRGVQKTLHAVGFSTLDRILGAAFGFARGCLIGIALLMAATALSPQSQMVKASVLSPYLFAVAHDVSFLVPQYFQRLMVDDGFDLKRNPANWINRH